MEKDWLTDGMPRALGNVHRSEKAPRLGAYFSSSGESVSGMVAGASVGSLLLFVRRVSFGLVPPCEVGVTVLAAARRRLALFAFRPVVLVVPWCGLLPA